MKEMNRHLKALEFDKVLELLAVRACNDDAKDGIMELRPETDIKAASRLVKMTEDAYILLAKHGGPSFGGLKNVTNSLSRAAAGGVLSMKELLDIASTVRAVRSISEWRSNSGQNELSIDIYFNSLMPNKYLEDKITAAILSEDEMSDNASPELASIRRQIKNKENSVRDQLEKLIRSQNLKTFLQDAIITQRNGRYVVPVKSEHRSSVSGLVHDTSSTGATVFVEPAGVVEANNDIRVLKGKEAQEIERILYELSVEAGNFVEEIKGSYECAVEINIIFCKAHLAYQMKASVPVLNDKGITDLRKARHPLIDPKKVVATDIRLGSDFDTLVITGPNTGGKTVAIKTVGLLSCMAASGLMIPAADESKVSVYENVLVDIGDEQSIEQSLSTFSSHMVNIVNILKKANEKSLVLIDELGAGTDPIEGAALAQSILEKVTSCKCLCASTTHYAELKAYALDTEGVTNASCEFDVQTLRPTYKLSIGLPGRSNAFAIASKLGISQEIIKASKAKIDNGTRSFEGLIGKLERQRIDLESKKESTEKKLAHAEKMYDEAEKLRQKFNAKVENESRKAEQKAQELLERARASADYVFDQLQELQRQKDAEDFKKKLEETRENVRQSLGMVSKDMKIADKIEVEYTPPREYAVGDTVVLADFGKNGIISSIDGENVVVAMGSAKIKTTKKKIRLTEKAEDKKSKATHTPRKMMDVKSEVDVRGFICDDAIFVIDKFLDDAVMSSLPSVRIIHGKGTGALRKGLWDYFKRDKRIASYRMGSFGEGDAGVTVVTLK